MKSASIPTFLHIEKTGGTTLIYTLRRNFPLGHCDIIPRDQSANVAAPADIRHAIRIHCPLRSLAGHSLSPILLGDELADQLSFYTLLRPATDRYISEYHHDAVKRGFDDGFASWLRYEERWNWQTKSLCGSDDLEQAKEVLQTRIAIVGTLEDYHNFVDQVATLFAPLRFNRQFTHLNQAGLPAGAVAGDSRLVEPIPPCLKRKAEQVNQVDTELYHYVKERMLPEQRKAIEKTKSMPASSLTLRPALASARLRLYSLFRNGIYKPSCGIWPGKIHKLPLNEVNVKRNRVLRGLPLPADDC